MLIVSGIAALWWAVSLGLFLFTGAAAILHPLIRRPRREPAPAAVAPVSMILPVKFVNPGFARAQASAFAQDYPAYEVLVCAAETQSEALQIMRGVMASAPVPSRLFHASDSAAVSPKLDTMTPGLAGAAHDVLLTKDSNITFVPGTIANLMQSFGEGVGLVCAVPVAMRPEDFGGMTEALVINRDARLLLSAAVLGQAFGVGKVMLFRRGDFERAGGLAAMQHTIAEDSAFEKGMAAIGLRTVFASRPVDQEIGARRLREVYARQARWAAIRRLEVPAAFPLEPVACTLTAVIAAALAAPLAGFGALAGAGLTLLFYLVAEAAICGVKGWPLSLATPAAILVRDGILLAAWAKAWTTREVVWAGQKKAVHAGKR